MSQLKNNLTMCEVLIMEKNYKEYITDKAIVRIHGEVDEEHLKKATIRFLQEVQKENRMKAKQQAERSKTGI